MPTKNLRIEHLHSSYDNAKILRRGFALLRMTGLGDCAGRLPQAASRLRNDKQNCQLSIINCQLIIRLGWIDVNNRLTEGVHYAIL